MAEKKISMNPFRWISRGLTAAVVVAAGLFGYSLLRADLAADVYLDRLQALASDYETLRGTFNEAISKTAVTELVVEEGELFVHVRNASGEVTKLETPYDPSGEIYVDFVVVDGRLLIRRLFDAKTRPADAMVIDDELADVNWEAQDSRLGKAVYRALGEGRWVITVTANGSLDLAQAPEGEEFDLVASPPVREYEVIHDDAKGAIEEIGPGDVIRRVFYGKPAKSDEQPE
ncbi:MAG: hypothetical protein ED559_12730 [Phycisphaera sp.]|nr:MAG: hypothetical protein ED559_12730 [Phycisphaera sp.]